jgi:CubicO group peptidase (beta-lactamase class C family)
MLSLLLTLLQTTDPVYPGFEEFTERWRGAMEAAGTPALAVVLVEGDEVVHRVTLGRRDPARDAPVTPETIFYIGSATKTFVAFALMQLAEQGKLDLDQPVKRYLPRLRLSDPALTETITVRDLLCHRYGINSLPIVLLDAFSGEITEERYYHFLPGARIAGRVDYSNVHFTLAGRVLESISGLGWREYLAEHVFAPAGMTRSTGFADWMYAQDDVAIPATGRSGRVVAQVLRKNDQTMHAAGGLGASIDDLARWLRVQLGGGAIDGRRLLGEEALRGMWELTSKSPSSDGYGPSEGYGLAWARGTYRGELELRHGGDYPGQSVQVSFLPELGLGLAVAATGDNAQDLCVLVSTDIHERLLSAGSEVDHLPRMLSSASALEARVRTSTSGEPAPKLALPLEKYVGTYLDEWYGTLRIELASGELRARLGTYPMRLTVTGPDALEAEGPSGLGGTLRIEQEGERVPAVVFELGEAVRFVRE